MSTCAQATLIATGESFPVIGANEAMYLVAAGGGGGAGYTQVRGTTYFYTAGGGGGAGGLRTGTQAISLATNYAVTVGAGGTAATAQGVYGGDGGSSSFSPVSTTGGGGGGFLTIATGAATAGRNGGSGGGAAGLNNFAIGGVGTAGQGNNGGGNTLGHRQKGYEFCVANPLNSACNDASLLDAVGNHASGAGGGAGGAASGTALGPGLLSYISGVATTYAAGGRVREACGPAWAFTPVAGTANRGNGGSGCDAANGGSGVVIVRYLSSYTLTNPGGGLTFTTTTSGPHKVTIITAGAGNIRWD